LNVSFHNKKDIQKLRVIAAINLAAGPQDKNYEIELLKVTLDGDRILKALTGTVLMKSILDSYFKALDFVPQLPFKAVSQRQLASRIIENINLLLRAITQ